MQEHLPCVIQRTDSYGQEGDGLDRQLCHRRDDWVRLPTLISVVDDDDRSDGAQDHHEQPGESGHLPRGRLAQEVCAVDGGRVAELGEQLLDVFLRLL